MMNYTELLPPLPEPHWPSTSPWRPYDDAYSVTNVRDAMLAAIAAATPAIRKAERDRFLMTIDAVRTQYAPQGPVDHAIERAMNAIRALPEEP